MPCAVVFATALPYCAPLYALITVSLACLVPYGTGLQGERAVRVASSKHVAAPGCR